jgi:hypothetical protein
MAAINKKRVLLGALVGGLVWNVWSMVVHTMILKPRYEAAQQSGHLLAAPRYGLFMPIWMLSLFVLAYIVAKFYAALRGVCGPGPMTAISVGLMIAFAAGFPENFASSAWSPVSRWLPFWWALDMGVGAVAAALIAGWLYKD